MSFVADNSVFLLGSAVALLLAAIMLVGLYISLRRQHSQRNQDIKRNRTPFFGRDGKLPEPEKDEKFRWQPQQDYDVVEDHVRTQISSETRIRLVRRQRGRKR